MILTEKKQIIQVPHKCDWILTCWNWGPTPSKRLGWLKLKVFFQHFYKLAATECFFTQHRSIHTSVCSLFQHVLLNLGQIRQCLYVCERKLARERDWNELLSAPWLLHSLCWRRNKIAWTNRILYTSATLNQLARRLYQLACQWYEK